jgi:hypothetical protein
MSAERMLAPEPQPSDDDMAAWVGASKPQWIDLRDYLARSYDMEPEVNFGGQKYGWCIRYRKSGRTLVTLYPERDAFTVLVVLGKVEVAKVEKLAADLSPAIRDAFENTEQLHDGRWLWLHPHDDADVASIEVMLAAKRCPKAAGAGRDSG